jgi:hypothetical protein
MDGDEIEHRRSGPGEDVLDPIAKLRPRLFRIDMPLLAPNDLREIRLGQEAQWRAWPIVEVRRFSHETLASVIDEADVGSRPEDREAQMLR